MLSTCFAADTVSSRMCTVHLILTWKTNIQRKLEAREANQ